MSISAANTHVLCRDLYSKDQHFSPQIKNSCLGIDRASKHCGFSVSNYSTAGEKNIWGLRRRRDREVRVEAFWPDLTRPTSVDMEPINDLEQFDQILAAAQEHSQPILVDWMASWCRKCIYLKPKLEKLAAEYDTKIKFYYVDVNKVPQALVKKGNISKMPTIQLWKDGEMKAEVIGGHKAWLVLDEIREMIQKFT